MSELTRCNFCSLNLIKEDAKKKGLEVTLIGGNCYAHPKNINIYKLNETEREKYFQAWFMELTDYCCC